MAEILIPVNTPETEFSLGFVQGMANRMGMSYHKYGRISEAYPHRVNALDSLGIRLEKYKRTGNTEYLIDAANFAMIEFMRPSVKHAHFTPTDHRESPGRQWHDEIDPSHRPNDPARWVDEA